MTCPACGPADGILEIRFDLEQVAAAWHARAARGTAAEPLAISRAAAARAGRRFRGNWPVGCTPILEMPQLARQLGVKQLWLKDEGRNPTASFKDRASSVGVAHALQIGAKTIACASTGNAASSLAGTCGAGRDGGVIFVPRNAAAPKVAQLQVFGAKVFSVAGPYDDAYDLCSAACQRFGWYNRNCAINPVLVEGKKTCWPGSCRAVGAVGRCARLGRGERRRWLHDRRHLEGTCRDARAGRDRSLAAAAGSAGGRRCADRVCVRAWQAAAAERRHDDCRQYRCARAAELAEGGACDPSGRGSGRVGERRADFGRDAKPDGTECLPSRPRRRRGGRQGRRVDSKIIGADERVLG